MKNLHAWLNRIERTLAQQAEARRTCTTCGDGRIELVLLEIAVVRTMKELAPSAWSSTPLAEDFCEHCGRRMVYRIPSPQRARG